MGKALKFDLKGKVKKEEKKVTKKSNSKILQLPEEFNGGVEVLVRKKELEAELKAIKTHPDFKKLENHSYDQWLDFGFSGQFQKSLHFENPIQDFKLVSQERFKKIRNEEDAAIFINRLGKENFEESTKTTTTLKGDLEEIQEKFNEFIKEEKIPAKQAKKFFEFIVENFEQSSETEFHKGKISYPDIFEISETKEESAEVIDLIVFSKPYLKIA